MAKRKIILAPSLRNDASGSVNGGPSTVQINNITNHRTKSSRNLAKFSTMNLDWDVDLIKNSLTESGGNFSVDPYMAFAEGYNEYSTLTGNNEFIAYYDQSYTQKRNFLRMFASEALIENCLESIADESIIYDSEGYFARIDLDTLKSKLSANDKSLTVINGLESSYKHVYEKFGFLESDDAWQYMKKFLTEGFLAFEIIYEYDEEGRATHIAGFKELDPANLRPNVVDTSQGLIKYWVQTQNDMDSMDGDIGEEIKIPDAHVIYISWASKAFQSKISYVERLVRSFNTLRQLENSRIIWNVQNAQKKIKIQVPVGEQNEERIKTRLGMFAGMYREEVSINTMSGEISYNGSSNFPFAKTYIVPSNSSGSVDIGEVGSDGYDLNSTEQLAYFWDRFISETKIPRNRFTNSINKNGQSSSLLVNDNTANHEEYAFHRFLTRIRSVFKEILLKPLWIEFGLRFPEYANLTVIKKAIGLEYNEENLFALYKEGQIMAQGATTISQLSSLQDSMGEPYFSNEFLINKFLNMNEDDILLNEKYKEINRKKKAKLKEEQDGNNQNDTGFGGNDFGGGFGGQSFGGGSSFENNIDFGGGDMNPSSGMDMGGSESTGGESTSGIDMGPDLSGGEV